MSASPTRAHAARLATLVVAASITPSIAACGDGDPGDVPARPIVHVAAAASMTDVLPPLADALEAEQGIEIALRFGASSTLARQILDGAPTDVLVSAEPRWIDELAARGLVGADDRAVIATNRLVAIVPADAREVPADLRSFAALPHLALAAAEVPAGAHARVALSRTGVLDLARDHIVEATDVRAALAWVAQGEAEGGIVYATDARIEPRVRIALELPAESHDPIRYEACAIARGPEIDPARAIGARAFVAMLGSAAARDALARAGFGPPT